MLPVEFEIISLDAAIAAYDKLLQTLPDREPSSAKHWLISTRYGVVKNGIDYPEQAFEPLIYLALTVLGTVYPFILNRDFFGLGWCLLHPQDYQQAVNDLYLAALKPLGYEDVVTEYPMLYRTDAIVGPNVWSSPSDRDAKFRAYLKAGVKHDVFSHFFGTKAEAVRWQVLKPGTAEFLQAQEDTLLCNYEHCVRVSKLTLSPNNRSSQLVALAMQKWVAEPYSDQLLVAAFDKSERRYVCTMQVYPELGGVCTAGCIAINGDPKYKPYSLALNAQIAMAGYILLNGQDYPNLKGINLGTNFTEAGDYKSRILHTQVPWFNFPAFNSYEIESGKLKPNWETASA